MTPQHFDNDASGAAWETPGPGRLDWLTPAGQHRQAEVHIRHTTSAGLVVEAREPLTVSQTVQVRWSQSARRAWVRRCQPHGGSFRLELVLLAGELRREERLSASGPAELRWRTPSKELRVGATTVRNISSGGTQVEIQEPVTVGEMVRMRGSEWECLGLARYCQSHGEGYLVGIEFTRQPFPKDSLDYAG